MPLKMTVGKVIRRILLYLGLAFASLVVFSLVFALSIRTHIVVPFRWVMLATFTGVLVAATVQGSRKYWRMVAFWFILAALLCLHLLAFILILRNFPEFRIFWYVPVVILEAGIFGAIYDLLLLRTSSRKRHT
jgi:hypothetical protein